MTYIGIIIGGLFVSNVILSSFLGICPFLGVSKNPKNAFGMSLALIFVVLFSAILSYLVYKFILVPLDLGYLKLLVSILIIASFVQFLEFFMKKFLKGLYKALGIYLPLITTNCVVLFVATNVTMQAGGEFVYNFPQMLVYALSIAVGYMIVINLFSFIRLRIDSQSATPRPFKGNAIALITAALMALAFMAFNGIA